MNVKKLAGVLCLAFSMAAFSPDDIADTAKLDHKADNDNTPPPTSLRMALSTAQIADKTADTETDAATAYWRDKSALTISANNAKVIFNEKADELRHPASLTKLMTLTLMFESLDRGDLTLDEKITFSKNASATPAVKLWINPGGEITVKKAIEALTILSANDVAVAVAEHMEGSEEEFAKVMTERARELGMTKTVFTNASGLPDYDQVTSAKDMAKLALHLIDDLSPHYHYFSQRSFTFGSRTYNTHNRLMLSYPGMDGLKTGYINMSGYNLVASAKRGNERIIGVVFGGNSSYERNNKMRRILDAAFARLALEKEKEELASPKTPQAETDSLKVSGNRLPSIHRTMHPFHPL